MATEFKSGDVVRLKSGGPNMTVTEIGEKNGEARAFCEWFDGEERHQEAFVLAVIEPSTSDARPKPHIFRRDS